MPASGWMLELRFLKIILAGLSLESLKTTAIEHSFSEVQRKTTWGKGNLERFLSFHCHF